MNVCKFKAVEYFHFMQHYTSTELFLRVEYCTFYSTTFASNFRVQLG